MQSQANSVIKWLTLIVALGGVAVLLNMVTRSVFHHSIPREDLERIAREYGWWAARRAEAVCPHMDVACVEREAKRLYETMIYRR